jgi:hypothetical protein
VGVNVSLVRAGMVAAQKPVSLAFPTPGEQLVDTARRFVPGRLGLSDRLYMNRRSQWTSAEALIVLLPRLLLASEDIEQNIL